MNENQNKVTIRILGESYSIKGHHDSEHIYKTANIVNKQMTKIMENNPSLTTTKIAVLAALNIADEYIRLEEDYKQIVKMLEDITEP